MINRRGSIDLLTISNYSFLRSIDSEVFCFVQTCGVDGVGVVDEEIGCLGSRDQARLEDAWPAEAPRNEGRLVGSDNENAQHTFRICCAIRRDLMYGRVRLRR
jgi:hypothetical protein